MVRVRYRVSKRISVLILLLLFLVSSAGCSSPSLGQTSNLDVFPGLFGGSDWDELDNSLQSESTSQQAEPDDFVGAPISDLETDLDLRKEVDNSNNTQKVLPMVSSPNDTGVSSEISPEEAKGQSVDEKPVSEITNTNSTAGNQLSRVSALASKSQTVETKTLAKGTKYATPLYIIKSGNPGPVVMIVGGVHGNETAGYKAAHQVKNYSIKKGTLLVLPEANKKAVDAHVRYLRSFGDLNRDFPKTKSENADNTLARDIFNTVKQYKVDWLMDMHEGANYSRLKSSSSVGQSLIYYPSSSTKPVANKIVNSLNKGYSTSYKKFSLLRYPISGSLARAAGKVAGANSFIFETCSKESLSKRVDNQIKAANILLSHLGMK